MPKVSPYRRSEIKKSHYLQIIEKKIRDKTATEAETRFYEQGECSWTIKDSQSVDRAVWAIKIEDGSAHFCLMCGKPINKQKILCPKCYKINEKLREERKEVWDD